MRQLIIAPLFIYSIILRHEGLHALIAWFEGAQIKKIRLFPGYREDLGFFFGYVAYGEGASWVTTFAPFIGALVSVLIAFLIAKKWNLKGLKRDIIIWFGILSPCVDLMYNYINSFLKPISDVAELMTIVNPFYIHIYFIFSFGICFWILNYFQSSRQAERKISYIGDSKK